MVSARPRNLPRLARERESGAGHEQHLHALLGSRIGDPHSDAIGELGICEQEIREIITAGLQMPDAAAHRVGRIDLKPFAE
jgi:hypothetical protein